MTTGERHLWTKAKSGRYETELMKVAFYGRLADAIGPEVDLETPPGSSVAQVRQLLAAEHPAAAATLRDRRSLACLGGLVVSDEHVVAPGDRLEFLPPVSGG